MENIDTSEALTYSSNEALLSKLEEIDVIISKAKSEGKQFYLSSGPENFDRIFHDYSDPDKGSILWKGLLDETIH